MLSISSLRSGKAIRAIAYVEAFKGALVLAAGTGVLALLHQDLHQIALRLVQHAHLNPASKYPLIFIDAASDLQDSRLVLIASGAAAYALLRFVEAYGLFRERAWAEMLSAASGALYVPFELVALVRKPELLSAGFLLLNLAVVAVMVSALLQRRRTSAAGAG
jgi:uncharacterized membrane protein (DUF2068 family)